MNQRCACGQEIDPTEFPPLICPTCGASLSSTTESSPTVPITQRRLPRLTPSDAILYAVLLVAALIVCWALVATVVIPPIQGALEAHRLQVCRDNLIKINDTLTVYRAEHGGHLPSLTGEPGRLMFTGAIVAEYSQLCGSPSTFCCPSQQLVPRTPEAEIIDDQSYFYLTHVVLSDRQAKHYAEALRDLMYARREIMFNIEVPMGFGSNGKDELLRTSQGVECLFFEVYDSFNDDMHEAIRNAVDAQIPIIVEWPSHHPEPGGHVLYLDGHVEFVKYPGPFPMTEHFIEAMRQLDQLSPNTQTNQ